MKIMVAGDKDSHYLLVRPMFKNYDLTAAANGAKALGKLLTGNFNLALTYMKMPVRGCPEDARKIRELNADIPIVALTANAFYSDRFNAMDA